MSTTSTVVVVALGVALLVGVAAVLRRGTAVTWPVIGLSALAAACCFVLAGAHVDQGPGPGLPIIGGGLAGILCLVAVIAVLAPSRRTEGPPGRLPVWTAVLGVLVGAGCLALTPFLG